ncbi:MAG: hypothetical protein GY928_21370 [Colwellia sp.]|nr:hypothetical protein [Colwellia sp.]
MKLLLIVMNLGMMFNSEMKTISNIPSLNFRNHFTFNQKKLSAMIIEEEKRIIEEERLKVSEFED